MKQYTTTAPQLDGAKVLTALCRALALVALYLLQQTAHAARIACRLVKACAAWLKGTHTFAPGQSDPEESITLTGWQYIGVAFAVTLFALVLSIDWDRTLASL